MFINRHHRCYVVCNSHNGNSLVTNWNTFSTEAKRKARCCFLAYSTWLWLWIVQASLLYLKRDLVNQYPPRVSPRQPADYSFRTTYVQVITQTNFSFCINISSASSKTPSPSIPFKMDWLIRGVVNRHRYLINISLLYWSSMSWPSTCTFPPIWRVHARSTTQVRSLIIIPCC